MIGAVLQKEALVTHRMKVKSYLISFRDSGIAVITARADNDSTLGGNVIREKYFVEIRAEVGIMVVALLRIISIDGFCGWIILCPQIVSGNRMLDRLDRIQHFGECIDFRLGSGVVGMTENLPILPYKCNNVCNRIIDAVLTDCDKSGTKGSESEVNGFHFLIDCF